MQPYTVVCYAYETGNPYDTSVHHVCAECIEEAHYRARVEELSLRNMLGDADPDDVEIIAIFAGHHNDLAS